ncbi:MULTISPECIES: FAD-dependent oxidoreductase [Micrococcaceae]|jgi:NADPH-dependent 2,4-dienoyl-CoA reductase/sulfur reductase-like enzyme|uniref:Ferredoxin reductase n=1 Tax=Paenarthrobacter aurescens (strain TC1) TaxID=290340 RepID=A1R864_PAEAT|nr:MULTISPECIES: FAD-dependent oxidoreductase [Micrococcaceae]ABM06356.1 putative ferredoxin reductase [Paenarthrobacter aurescens TC1]AFR29753.1 putative ferredoxin reductase / NAD(FAD)-dependent dehydrogenase [Arthrobacter sp. Rue61a]MBP2265180.1 NADPH-dependent 2,4-dienoyl-CoA reductase/sulfur reductase-like enzyme [Pseudarthrobacter sp. PvP004]
MAHEHMVIVGGGLAGATAAKTLRAEGYEGPVTLVAAENRTPYIRPPLSKEFLLGKAEADAALVVPDDWYGENDVELLLENPASRIEPADHAAVLADGRSLHYSKLLLATGARPRTIPLPGADLDGVMTFRTFDDSVRLQNLLKNGGKKVVMIGSGWIGMELAAAARTYGNDVTLLGLEDIPLSAAIGPELGAYFQRLHEDQGVTFRLPASAAGIDGQNGSATAVRTSTGETLPADVVIVAVGVVPDTALGEAAGLAIRNGILVDAGLRSSAPDVLAAGDVANALHPFTAEHHRSEHWANALNGGKVAAKSMMGQDAQLDVVPYFYTDQFTLSMEYSGFPSLTFGITPVIRGSLDDGSFIAFWLREGMVVAGMSVNQRRVQKPIKALISTRTPVNVTKLTDPGVPLDELQPGEQ